MATQSLEFCAATGLTIVCKLFSSGSDTVVATVTAVEKTNDKNRYVASFTNVPAGLYRLNGFVSSVGGFANEDYDLTLETATFLPLSESSDRDYPTLLDAINALSSQVVPNSQTNNLAGEVTIHSGVDFQQQFAVSVPSNWTKIHFTFKAMVVPNGDDTNAIVQIVLSNPSDAEDGLVRLNGAAASASTDGGLAVNGDRTAITVTLKAAATATLERSGVYDFKIFNSDGSVPYITDPGDCLISQVVTRSLPA